MSSDEMLSTDDDDEEESSDDLHPDLGRLYFALRYDQHRWDIIILVSMRGLTIYAPLAST